jgi:hypothetical protein
MNWVDSRGRRRAASKYVWALLMLAAVPLFLATGCRGTANDEAGISIDASIAPQPVRVGTETVLIKLTDESHQSVTGARIRVEGDMSHPGMAPVFADAVEVSPGSYQAQLNFNMGGDWVVLLHMTLSDGRKIERQMDVKGVESN